MTDEERTYLGALAKIGEGSLYALNRQLRLEKLARSKRRKIERARDRIAGELYAVNEALKAGA